MNEIQPLTDIQNYSNELFYDEKFMLVLERHLPLLKSNAISRVISPELAMKYKHDFMGLCIVLEIPFDHHWLVMRLNNMRTNMEFNGKLESILIPDLTTLEKIVSLHSQIQKMV